MKIWKRLIAAGLAAVLTAGGLAGCGGGGDSAQPSGDDIIQRTAGMPADTVVMTIDGREVTAVDYLYWAGYAADFLINYYYGGNAEALDWSDGTLAEYVQQNAMAMVSRYLQARIYAEDQGYSLTEEEKSSMESDIQQTMDSMGEAGEFETQLAMSALTTGGFRRMVEGFYWYDALIDRLYGENGATPVTEDDINAYLDDNGVYRAKHILLLTCDMESEPVEREDGSYGYPPLDDATIAEKKALADDLLSQLRESENPEELFDELMHEYSEDTGLATSPDGYTTRTGEMVPEFENTALALEEGEISEVVESTYGYHIILRLPVDTAQYRDATVSEKMDSLLSPRIEAQQVEYTDDYGKINLEEFYTALQDYRAEISAQESASQESAPQESDAG